VFLGTRKRAAWIFHPIGGLLTIRLTQAAA
jgi:hypothetical protein